ncbi:MAG: amidohydrolase/deacetylase family metallohydrolase [Gemmatimonadota bacterium]|nr:amidohydrolase/deacetylase family metallohydrolase [Gemmatimonadota bacterium]
MTYDLLLKGATVIDGAQGLNGEYDVAVLGEKIAAVEKEIAEPAKETVNLQGRILTPGWVDIHTHVYAGATTWGIQGDALCLATGVTTVVDAGSSGWANLVGFMDYVAAPARTQVLTFVHISGIGLTYGPVGEMEDMRYADPERTAFVIQRWPETCVGVKVREGRHQVGNNGVAPLKLAVKAARLSDSKVMVHMGAGVPLPDVLDEVRPGDIVTHCYRGGGDTILGAGEQVIPEVWAARDRGVLFDLGHGGGSFLFDVAKKALAQGFPSDVISTDLHAHCLSDPVHSLPETASKLLNLGMELPEVVYQTTAAPAAAIGRDDELGTLRVGTVADLAAFEVEEGAFEFRDVRDNLEVGARKIQPVLTVRKGSLYRPDELQEEVAETLRRAREMNALVRGRFERRQAGT